MKNTWNISKDNLINRFFNSWLWFNIYYHHTKQHKDELKTIKEGILRTKNKVLNKIKS